MAKSQKYYNFRVELEIMLAKYFEIALKMLIYNLKYQFNPRCHILTLLYQSTYEYYFLHQKLIEITLQDIDQQLSAGGTGGNMTVSNSFIVYQLHWESKLLHLSKRDQDALREHMI